MRKFFKALNGLCVLGSVTGEVIGAAILIKGIYDRSFTDISVGLILFIVFAFLLFVSFEELFKRD